MTAASSSRNNDKVALKMKRKIYLLTKLAKVRLIGKFVSFSPLFHFYEDARGLTTGSTKGGKNKIFF